MEVDMGMTNSAEPQSSLVTREVCYSFIRAMVDEMEVLIGRAAMSEGFRDKKDYFVGIFDPRGRMIHALMSYSGAGMANAFFKYIPAQEMEPGDIFLFNDPYHSDGAVQHLSDTVIGIPIFADGKMVAFATAFGHLADLGGVGTTPYMQKITDVHQEGTAYPVVRAGHGAEFSDDFLRLFLRNSRRPDVLYGDISALLGACKVAEARITEVIGRYGLTAFTEMVDWVIETSAAKVSSIIDMKLTDGRYSATSVVDIPGDGDQETAVALDLEVKDGALHVDLQRSSDQVTGRYNYLASLGGVQLLTALLFLVFDEDLSMNEGTLSCIRTVKFRNGSIVQPEYPAPLQLRSQVKSAVSNCLAETLAQAADGYMTAPQPTYVTCIFHFDDTGRSFTETLGVGLGARPFGDGPDVVYAPAQRNYPIEMVESEEPLLIERYGMSPGSGGWGRYRGGRGAIRRIHVLADCHISPSMSNTVKPSPGVAGGSDGTVGRIEVTLPDGTTTMIPGIASNIAVPKGSTVTLVSAGGGGWG